MGRSFVSIKTGSSSYKLYVPDIKKIYKVAKKKTPTLPIYEDDIKSVTSEDTQNV